MKFLFDNNLSPTWPEALRALSRTLDHVDDVVHLRDKFSYDAQDDHWLSVLAAEGSWAVISKDAFNKTDNEKQLIRSSGLSVFMLAPAWGPARPWDSTVQIVRWWPHIVAIANRSKAALRVPWNIGSKLGSMRL
jgi:hypothetical protein